MARAAVLGLLASSVFACGGDTETDLTPAKDFEREVAARCDLQPSGDGLSMRQAEALREGRAHFEPAHAEHCLAWLEDNPCPREGDPTRPNPVPFLQLRLPGVCRKAYSGTVAPGDDCGHNIECAGDAYCEPVSDNPPTSRCALRTPPGAACFGSISCSVADDQVPNCVSDASGAKRCVAE